MIRINLLAADRAPGKKRAAPTPTAAPGAFQAYLFLGLFVGGMLFLCAAAWWFKSAQIKDLDTQTAAAEKRQKELQAIKAQVDAFQAKKESIQRQVILIETLKANQRGPVQMLDRISRALPDFVWLTELDQVGSIVKFKGESSSLSAVADFMSNLGNSGENCGKPKPEDRTQCWFSEVNLVSSVESKNVVTFQLQTIFKDPEVAAKEKEAAAAAASAAAAAAAAAPAKPGARRAPAPAGRS